MASNQYTFEINGKPYGVLFGMTAQEIFLKKSIEMAKQADERGESDSIETFRTFVTTIYAGISNYNDRLGINRLSWIDCYDLASEMTIESQEGVFAAFNESQPIKEMLERLNISTETEPKKKSTTKQSGKKSKPLHSES